MTRRARLVAEGVHRLRLDSPCGLVTNAYVIQSAGAVALVDSGFTHTLDQLDAALGELGLAVEAVTDLLLTHFHNDHVGGAIAFADRFRGRTWVWEGAAPAFGDLNAHLDATRDSDDWPLGVVGTEARCEPLVIEIQSKPRISSRVPGDGRLANPAGVPFGGVVGVGGLRFVCVDARGHDPHHCAWMETTTGMFFSGDAVLAVLVPLVRGMGDRPEWWLATLSRWERTLDATALFPGHGMPTRLVRPSIARSVESFARIHDETARQLVAGSATPLAIAQALLPHDASRFAARSSAMLATIDTLLRLGQDQGWASVEGGVWVSDDVPTVEELASG